MQLEAWCGADILNLVLNKVAEVLGGGQWPGLQNPSERLSKPVGNWPPCSLHRHGCLLRLC